MMVCLNCGIPFHICVALSKPVVLLHFSNICKIEIVFHRIVSRFQHADIGKIQHTVSTQKTVVATTVYLGIVFSAKNKVGMQPAPIGVEPEDRETNLHHGSGRGGSCGIGGE